MLTIRLPNDISNAIIQSLGVSYLNAHDYNSKSYFTRFFDARKHTNHPVATKLKDYDEQSDDYEKWQFLAECFGELAKSTGELANQISLLFNSAFVKKTHAFRLIHDTNTINQSILDGDGYLPRDMVKIFKFTIDYFYINAYREMVLKQAIRSDALAGLPLKNNPDALSIRMIQNLGEQYLQKYPTLSVAHNNQSAAEKLKNCIAPSDPYEKWIYLAETYALLKESKGKLSDSMLGMVVSAFHKSVYTHELCQVNDRYGGHNDDHYYPPDLIASAIKGIINEHYAHQYRQLIQEQRHVQAPPLRLTNSPA